MARLKVCAEERKKKRDGNSPTGSGQAPFTEGRAQRAERQERKG